MFRSRQVWAVPMETETGLDRNGPNLSRSERPKPVLSCPDLCCLVPSRSVLSCPVLSVFHCSVVASAALPYPPRSCPIMSRAVPFSSVRSCDVCYSMLNPHAKAIHFVHTYLRNSALVLCALRLLLLRPIHTARALRNTIAGGSRIRAKSAIA